MVKLFTKKARTGRDGLAANEPTLRVSKTEQDTSVDYLTELCEELGGDHWVVTLSGGDAGIVSEFDLADAKARATGAITLPETLASSGPVAAALESLQTVAITAVPKVKQLLRDVFGPRAYVRPLLDRDDEDGTEELVIEAHYARDPKEALEVLAPLHEQFLRRYVAQLDPDLRAQITLVSVATDADHA